MAGVVRGIRKWEVGGDRQGIPRLLGYSNWAWQPWGKPTIAACLAVYGAGHAGDEGEAAPATNCTCGLYAHHPWARKATEDFDLLSGVSPEDDWLIGVVDAWGKLEVHEDGFRAQFARPVLLVAGTPEAGEETDTLDRVAAEYRCSTVRVDSAGDLRDLFGEVSGALDRSFVEELVASIPPPAPWTPPPPPRVRTWDNPWDRPGIVLDHLWKVGEAIGNGAVLVGTWIVKGAFYLMVAYLMIAFYGGFLFFCGLVAYEIIKAIVT